jgi:diadenosine tetraphosphate (Ap4A) HIT family hydrolase
MSARCDFCVELAGGTTGAFHERFGTCLESRVVMQTRHLVVLPSLGPLGIAHALIVPRRHVGSFAALNDEERADARNFLTSALPLLNDLAGSLAVFEHGIANPGSPTGGCGITHAHLHLVALNDPPPARPRLHGLCWRQLPPAWIDSLPRECDYLMVGAGTGEMWVAEAIGLPSQFMRRWIAKEIGVENWDWRHDRNGLRVLQHARSLHSVLEGVNEQRAGDIRVGAVAS